ncbi:MAG: J domain-containing protein [bacterium]
MDPQFKKEVMALARIIDEMDYYQILKVKQKAFTEEIKRAYFKQSRLFHPDKYYNEDPALVNLVTKIFKRMNEAYKVLSDPRKRPVYTRAINGPQREKFLRFDPKMMENAGAKEKEDEGQTAMGKKYYQMAKTAINNKDYNAAKINLQLASKMEPNNKTFKSKLQEVEETLKMRKKKS